MATKTPKKKPYVRPRWDDMDNFAKKIEERNRLKISEHPVMAAKIIELNAQLSEERRDRNAIDVRYERMLEEARCERDTATEKYLELSRWVDNQRRKKKGLRGPRP